jgi:hypothetical protein
MTCPAEFDIGDSGRSALPHIAVAEGTVQINFLLMDAMVEKDRLVHRFPGKNGKEGEEDHFRLILKSMVGNHSGKKDEDDDHQKANLLHHDYKLSCKKLMCQAKINSHSPFSTSEEGEKWKHLQFRDDRMDSRGAGGPDSEIFRIADH